METRTVEQVEGWDSRSFSGGYDGLRTLSDREFSGAVRAGGAWLFMLNGRIIGVYEGSLESFEDASGTAYSAPHPSLPLLFSMQEQGGETQAKYYTNDTALSEADSTLKSGSFTGFVELSENVLSGDYYVAYYGGRSMSVAFVGASEQILTGDEAFQRANDEVGIYEVRNVDLDVIDVPEPEGADDESAEAESEASAGNAGSATTAGAGGAGATGRANAGGNSGASSESTETQATTEATGDYEAFDPASGSASETEADSAQSPDAEQTPNSGSSPVTPAERERTDDANADSTESTADTDAATGEAATQGESSASPSASESPAQSPEPSNESSRPGTTRETAADASEEEASAESAATAATTSADSDSATDSDGDGSAFEDEEKWRETTTIPSLNPDRSEPRSASAGASGAANAAAGTTERTGESGRSTKSSAEKTGASSERSARTSSAGSDRPRSATQASDASGRERQSNSGAQSPQANAASGERQSDADERTTKLRSKLQQSQQQVEQLEQRLSTVESERDELERERNTLRQEVERLESKLATAREGGDSSAGRQLTAAQAFEGTNLFVRYQSKGKATLEAAATGDADPDDVNANLQLEHHTQFDAEDVAVDGASFESFLENSFEHEFAAWIVEELLYEIRDTGHRGHLRDLYDAIPKVDRVDFRGTVGAGEDEDGTRQETFDVIMRDRMGNPLVVADLNASRDPTTGEMMGSLVDAATGVAEAHEELAGAFQVTASFFEPDALETAESATSGGFLSREKRESFVKLSRKRGFHLCLVESRSGGFHLTVPEL